MDGGNMVVRRAMLPALLCAVVLLTPITTHAAIFDDGNDRHTVNSLRSKKNPTGEEEAILEAANKVGNVLTCNKKRSANAFVIRYPGCPANGAAVVTSAHSFLNKDGSLLCSIDEQKKIYYYPNLSYYDPKYPRNHSQNRYATQKIGLSFPPENWSGIRGSVINDTTDMGVFCLSKDITRDKMLDGRTRGYLKRSKGRKDKDEIKLYMLGTAPDFKKGYEMAYQKQCDGRVNGNIVYHACDNYSGSSGSLLATLEDGELSFMALHNSSALGVERFSEEDKRKVYKLNGGTSSGLISAKRHPSELAHDLQRLLRQAGCYSGKLDGDWGPGSRKALAAFTDAASVTLLGTEPSADLLAAVEKAAPEGTEVCRR